MKKATILTRFKTAYCAFMQPTNHVWLGKLGANSRQPYGPEAGLSVLHNVIIDFDRRELRVPTRLLLNCGEIRGEFSSLADNPLDPALNPPNKSK